MWKKKNKDNIMQRGDYSVVKVRKYKTIFHVTPKQKQRNIDHTTVDLHDCTLSCIVCVQESASYRYIL